MANRSHGVAGDPLKGKPKTLAEQVAERASRPSHPNAEGPPAAQGGAAVLPDPPAGGASRKRDEDDAYKDFASAFDSFAKGYYTGPAIAVISSAGPRAADYAARVGLALDAAGRPMVSPGVGGYASPRETDNAVETFLDTSSQDQMQAAMNQRRMASLIARLGQYR